jgi:phosphonatase-like hydrolase
MSIKLAVFDIAGTTVKDSNNVHEALQKALLYAGFHYTIEEINPYMGIPKPLAIKYSLEQRPTLKNFAADEEFIQNIHTDFVKEMLLFYQTSDKVEEKPHATAVFKALKNKGIKIVLDTGFSREITNAILEKLGWDKGALIDFSVTSDEVINGRPHPDLIFKAMELCGIIDSQEVAKIGDTSSDLQEGTAAHCKYVIGVTTGAFSKEDLEKEPHTHLIADLREVLEIFEEL